MINGVERVEIEVIKKTLAKYGFYSFKKEPFLYVQNNEFGISFTLKDNLYGELTRAFIPSSLEELEDFLGKYSWFKKCAQKYQIEIKLSDYKSKNPQIKFIKDSKEYTLDDLIKLSNEINSEKDNAERKKEEIYIKKLKRTLFLLIEVIKEKIKIQEDSYQNLLRLKQEYHQKYNHFVEIKKEYSKEKKADFLSEETLEKIPDFTSKIEKMLIDINKTKNKKELENQIDNLISFIKELETNKNLITNKYELIKLPLELEKITKKIEIIEKASRKKRGFFAKKENIDIELKEIDEKSMTKQIVSYENYEKNELERLEEKYAMIPELDRRTIGDFLIEFDNLKIKEPDFQEKQEEKELSYEEVMTNLEESFEKRTLEEKKVLTMYHSFLRKIILDEKLTYTKDLEDFINHLENPNNILFKLKYFKKIETITPEKCLISLKNEAKKILEISPDILKGDINVFFKDNKIIKASNFLAASNKRMLAPAQYQGENDTNYIALLKKNSKVYFIPNEITYDIENDEILIQKNNQPFFLIDLKKNNFKYSSSDIIKIVRYQNKMICENKITIVTDLVSTKIDQYKNIIIEGKD